MTAAQQNAGTRSKTKKTKAQYLKERRKVREDLGSDRNVMTTPKLPGMVVRWVNDETKSGVNRITRLKRLGWAMCDAKDASIEPPQGLTSATVSEGQGTIIAVGLTREGEQMNAYLMMIPQELYEADQALKEEAIREQEEAILNEGDAPGMYGGIRIGTA